MNVMFVAHRVTASAMPNRKWDTHFVQELPSLTTHNSDQTTILREPWIKITKSSNCCDSFLQKYFNAPNTNVGTTERQSTSRIFVIQEQPIISSLLKRNKSSHRINQPTEQYFSPIERILKCTTWTKFQPLINLIYG